MKKDNMNINAKRKNQGREKLISIDDLLFNDFDLPYSDEYLICMKLANNDIMTAEKIYNEMPLIELHDKYSIKLALEYQPYES